MTLLSIQNLDITFQTHDGDVEAVKNVSFDIQGNECLGIVGESGSGKSQTMFAATGLLAPTARTRGSIKFQNTELLGASSQQMQTVMGKEIGMIFQDPLTSLTPHLRVIDQLTEVLHTHGIMEGAAAEKRALEMLDMVRINEGARRAKQYPHELSGGMRQRVMIAMAMIAEPKLLIADEPTTALDVTIQSEILRILDELRREQNTAIALITHDMGVVARMCDRLVVMRHGEVVERGSLDEIFYQPKTDYTRELLDATPRIDGPLPEAIDVDSPKPVVSCRELDVHFPIDQGFFKPKLNLRAVHQVNLDVFAGESLGIVGESGCGKSTLARALLCLQKNTGGEVNWGEQRVDHLSHTALAPLRRETSIVFQDPLAALNPRRTVGQSIMEPLLEYGLASVTEAQNQTVAMLERVGLDKSYFNRYPHELSGGQNQRVGIARAVISKPKLLVCDEAVSALDVSVQAQVIELLKALQQEMKLALIFISHDLAVVRQLCHRVVVMYLGRPVEIAPTGDLFDSPRHPYTTQLFSAIPLPDPKLERQREVLKLSAELQSPMDPTAHLRFLPSRAGQADYEPKLVAVEPEHWVAEFDPA